MTQTLAEFKKQIVKAFPFDETFAQDKLFEIVLSTGGTFYREVLTVGDIKALADSHTKLLKAAKDMKNACNGAGGAAFQQHAYDRLEAAIEEAEK